MKNWTGPHSRLILTSRRTVKGALALYVVATTLLNRSYARISIQYKRIFGRFIMQSFLLFFFCLDLELLIIIYILLIFFSI